MVFTIVPPATCRFFGPVPSLNPAPAGRVFVNPLHPATLFLKRMRVLGWKGRKSYAPAAIRIWVMFLMTCLAYGEARRAGRNPPEKDFVSTASRLSLRRSKL